MTRRRRILTIGRSYTVAVNRKLAHELARQGRDRWEVTVVAPAFTDAYLRPVSFETSADEPCRVEVLPAHLTRWVHFMAYGSRLGRILSEPWDLVHCWEEPYILAGAQVAHRTPRRIPFVFRTYQNIDKRYPPPFCWLERYCLNRCAGWEAAGVEVVKTAAGRGYDVKPHRMIPGGVDVEAFCPSPARREHALRRLGFAAEGPPIVGFLGRFVPEKGPILLARILDRTASSWRALFVGDGLLENDLKRWAGRYGDRVRIVTGIRHGEVPAYLNAMDILCADSQTTPRWREQFGQMTLEAFACGVPVIGSDSGEIPHVIQDAGVVVSEKDEDGWVRALSDLLENPARRKELAARGLDRAKTVYAWPVVARARLGFFEELLDSRGDTK